MMRKKLFLPVLVLFSLCLGLELTSKNAYADYYGHVWLSTSTSAPSRYSTSSYSSSAHNTLTLDRNSASDGYIYFYIVGNVITDKDEGGQWIKTTDIGVWNSAGTAIWSGISDVPSSWDNGGGAIHDPDSSVTGNSSCWGVTEAWWGYTGGWNGGSYSCGWMWSTPKSARVKMSLAEFDAAASIDGKYKYVDVVVWWKVWHRFWCDGSSGCGDEGWKTGNGGWESQPVRIQMENPEYTATFDGNVTYSTSDSWTCQSGACVGTGLKKQYSLNIYYQERRTNNEPNYGVSSQFAYSPANNAAITSSTTSSYPSSAAFTTGALSESTSFSNVAVTNHTVTVPVNGSFSKCFYLSYADKIKVTTSSTTIESFNGRKRACLSFSNPAKSYTASFSAASDVSINGSNLSPTVMTIADNFSNGVKTGQTAVLVNYKRNSDDTFSGNWPSSSYATATATFTHQIRRAVRYNGTDYSPAADWYAAKSSTVKSAWVVQEKLNGGSWTNTSTSGTASFDTSNNNYQLVANTPQFSRYMTRATEGLYVTYCQRLRYSTQTTYTPVVGNTDYSLSDPSYSYGTGNEMCVVFRNPKWIETQKTTSEDYAPLTHEISVKGSTAAPSVTNAHLESDFYSIDELELTVDFPNSIARFDAERFDEGNLTAPGNGGTFDRRFDSSGGSMYNNANFTVSSAYLSRINYHLLGQSDNYIYVAPEGANTTARANYRNYPAYSLSFAASSRTSHTITSHTGDTASETWSSTPGDGNTVVTVGAQSSSQFSLLAGQTKLMCNQVYNTAAIWNAQYVDIYHTETYTGSSYTTSEYSRTKLALNRPQVSTGSSYISDNPSCVTLHRDYNFNVTSLSIQTPLDATDSVTTGGQDFETDYLAKVERFDKSKNFVTDLENAEVYSIGYTIPAGTDHEIVKAVTDSRIVDYSGRYFCSNVVFSEFGTSGDSCRTVQKNLSSVEGADNRFENKVYGKNASCVDADNNGLDDVDGSDCYRYEFTIKSDSFHIDDLTIGDKFCIQLAITPLSNVNHNTLLSRASCINIGKKPNAKILGSSVLSLSDIKGALTRFGKSTGSSVQKNVYGSSVEFAIMANGAVSNIASGMKLVNGRTDSNSVLCEISPLTIANSDCITKNPSKVSALGKANIAMDSSFGYRIANRYHGSRNEIFTSEIDENTFEDAGYCSGYDADGHCLIHSEKPIIVYSNDDIIIHDDIIHDDSYQYEDTKVTQIYIVAIQKEGSSYIPNIYIDADVTRLDAFLVTSGAGGIGGGTVDTCAYATVDDERKRVLEPGNEPAPDSDEIKLSAGICDDRLTINGGIAAGKVRLKRTYGANNLDDILEPAEIINFRSSVYLSGYESSSASFHPTTTYVRELAPRY